MHHASLKRKSLWMGLCLKGDKNLHKKGIGIGNHLNNKLPHDRKCAVMCSMCCPFCKRLNVLFERS